MGYRDEEAIDLIREGDLDIWVSFGFVMYGSMASFVEIREMAENHLKSKKGENLVHSTTSSPRLYLVKEKDYELIKQIKDQEKYLDD